MRKRGHASRISEGCWGTDERSLFSYSDQFDLPVGVRDAGLVLESVPRSDFYDPNLGRRHAAGGDESAAGAGKRSIASSLVEKTTTTNAASSACSEGAMAHNTAAWSHHHGM